MKVAKVKDHKDMRKCRWALEVSFKEAQTIHGALQVYWASDKRRGIGKRLSEKLEKHDLW